MRQQKLYKFSCIFCTKAVFKCNPITLKYAEKSKDVNEEINKQDIKSGKKIIATDKTKPPETDTSKPKNPCNSFENQAKLEHSFSGNSQHHVSKSKSKEDQDHKSRIVDPEIKQNKANHKQSDKKPPDQQNHNHFTPQKYTDKNHRKDLNRNEIVTHFETLNIHLK